MRRSAAEFPFAARAVVLRRSMCGGAGGVGSVEQALGKKGPLNVGAVVVAAAGRAALTRGYETYSVARKANYWLTVYKQLSKFRLRCAFHLPAINH